MNILYILAGVGWRVVGDTMPWYCFRWIVNYVILTWKRCFRAPFSFYTANKSKLLSLSSQYLRVLRTVFLKIVHCKFFDNYFSTLFSFFYCSLTKVHFFIYTACGKRFWNFLRYIGGLKVPL